MSKNKRPAPAPKEAPAPGMTVDAILGQLSSMKDNAASFLEPDPADPDGQEVWIKDIEACEAATAILTALQDEGIEDPEQVRDLIHDYKGLAKQYQDLHQKYEAAAKPKKLGGAYLCPDCNRQMRPGNAFCWNCGKRLDWRR